MKKRWSFYFIVTLILLIPISLVSSLVRGDSVIRGEVVNGAIDLTSFELTKDAVELHGEWKFIPGKLVKPDELDRYEAMTVHVPESWTTYTAQGKRLPAFTSATYYLDVKLRHDIPIYGLKTTNIRMSNSIFVDGVKVGESGKPGLKNGYVPRNTPYVGYFIPKGETARIVIHISNYHYAPGSGMIGSLYIGDEQRISDLREKSLAFDWVMISAFLLMGVYFLGFSTLLKKETYTVYFSFYCLANAIYSATHGEKLLHHLYPNLPYEVFVRLQGISTICMGIFLLYYYHYSLPTYSRLKVVRSYAFFGLLLILGMFLPVTISTHLQYFQFLYIVVGIILIIYIQIISFIKKVPGVLLLTIGSLSLIAYYVIASINASSELSINYFPPYLPFVFLSMLSFFIAGRLAKSYRDQEEFSELLLEVDRQKDEFLAKTSHEFRTPLHGISAIMQSMLEHSKQRLSIEETQKLSLVLNISRRLSNLVNDMIDVLKIKQGVLRIERTGVDLQILTTTIVDILSFLKNKEVEVLFQIGDEARMVYADEDRVKQILYNLIENALKYTESGKVIISSKRLRDEMVEVSIQDTGTGMDEATVAHMFEPFVQGVHSRTRGGAGLGLNITKQLVELLGGNITVQTKLHEGSTFTFTLPALNDVTTHLEDEPIALGGSFVPIRKDEALRTPFFSGKNEGKHILVVDDHHTSLRVLSDFLTAEGYYVIATDSGANALELVNKHHVDVVLLDMMMPGMSGVEVCEDLRKTYSLDELPILMLTAAVMREDRSSALEAGANDFLQKPFDIVELRARIRGLVMLKEIHSKVTRG